MAKLKVPEQREIELFGHYTLHATGIRVTGRPTFEMHEGVGAFIKRAHRASGFWLADWLRYGDARTDWKRQLDQAVDATGLTEKTLKNVRAVGAIPPSRRRDDVDFTLHEAVTSLTPEEQSHWLDQAALHGWGQREMRLNIRAAKRRTVIEGQAFLEGQYRVIYADPPWMYGNRPPSGSGQHEHYPGMTIADICKLPVEAHATKDAVLFLWTTSPFLLMNPGPREVIEAWGFTYKTSIVWDKVRHNFGSYVSVRHELLLICTRGSCVPDRPTPMPDSVQTIRQEGEHSAKPEDFRRLITQLYDGPYLELFARQRTPGWAAFGNDARLWAQEKTA